MSRSHKELKQLVFSKRSGPIRDSKYYARYDPNSDISTGYYHGNNIITIYWEKDRVVLSDSGWRTRTTKMLLNQLLPNYIQLFQRENQWFLHDSHYVPPQGLFTWTGSQVFSLSKHYGIHITPFATITFGSGSVYIKPVVPFKVVTIKHVINGYSIGEASLYPSQSSRLQRWEYHHIQLVNSKKEALNMALTYAIEHKLPFIEKLPRRSSIRYAFNPSYV